MSSKKTTAANVNELAEDIPGRDRVARTTETSPQSRPLAEAPQPEPKVEPVPAAQAAPTPAQPAKKKRRPVRLFLMGTVPLALLAVGAYVWVTGGRYEDTDNSYLKQARVSIVSEAAGRIASVNVIENQQVKQGDLLFTVDPKPYQIALAQSDAAINSARLGVEQLRAAYNQAVSAQKVATDQVTLMQSEFDRQQTLTKKGIGTGADFDTAKTNLANAKSQLASAGQAVAGAVAALNGDPNIDTDKHPSVVAALAARDQATFNLSQTKVFAPGDGVIYQASSLKTGQYVAPGVPLFVLVETGDTWIDANFKETQLTHIKVGQPAEVVLDAFPDAKLKAVVDSIGAGTGSEFSVLPPQNATGNWVKVTQRIPVRIKVESSDPNLLLRTGMSAEVTIDTGKARGWGSIEKMVKGWI